MLRKLGLAGVIWCGLAGGAQAQTVGPPMIACNATFEVSQGATALTRIITAGGKTITLCGFDFNAGAAAATAQLQYGTGTNCGTGAGAITPAFSLGVNGVLTDHVAGGQISPPQGNDVCLVTTGTGPMQVLVYYTVN